MPLLVTNSLVRTIRSAAFMCSFVFFCVPSTSKSNLGLSPPPTSLRPSLHNTNIEESLLSIFLYFSFYRRDSKPLLSLLSTPPHLQTLARSFTPFLIPSIASFLRAKVVQVFSLLHFFPPPALQQIQRWEPRTPFYNFFGVEEMRRVTKADTAT